MHWSSIGWIVGAAWVSLAGVLLVPLGFASLWAEPWRPFAVTAVSAFALGAVLLLLFRAGERSLRHRDAFLIVSAVWVSACAFGALPFALYPEPRLSPVDALFESVSGFTTTGSTVLSGLDALPGSLLLWRSLTQWLGGMGIVVLGVAVLPFLGVGGMQLYRAEAPGPTKDKLTPRVAETAKLLWMLYLGLTLAAASLFYLDGMSAFDALNHAMTAISTGGFSTHDASFGHYPSRGIHLVATLAMLAGGTSFAVLRRLLVGEPAWREQPELRAYIGLFLAATVLLTLDLRSGMPEAFSSGAVTWVDAAFQAASLLTTTGYATTDFDRWPAASHLVLLLLILVGGMAGSTAGGPKLVRVLLLAKVAGLGFARLARPRSIHTVGLAAARVDERVLMGSLGFLAMWLLLLALGTLALSSVGTDLGSSLLAAASCLGNVGPGFGAVGPSHTFAAFDAGSKLVMEMLMLLGRLEIYTVLVILTPSFWRA